MLGLDPDPLALWPQALEESGSSGAGPAERTARAVARHCRLVIDAAGPACVAIKPQLACFERLGSSGWRALEETVEHARECGLLVLADGKRGDVPVTAAAYAQGLCGETPGPFGAVPGLGADAFTVNPLLGRDALDPFADAAAAAGAGLFCLVRTSNPGAADVQDLETPQGPVHEQLARMVDGLSGRLAGSGELSGAGAVTGATRPDLLRRLRELMPRAPLLLPGVGAQGGSVEALEGARGAHPAACLVAASRSIAGAHGGRGNAPSRLVETCVMRSARVRVAP